MKHFNYGVPPCRTDIHESYEIISRNIVSDLQSSVHGKVFCHYNRWNDILEVSITNRALNAEPFRYHYYNLSRDMNNGITSTIIARFVVKEYQDYVSMFFFRKY